MIAKGNPRAVDALKKIVSQYYDKYDEVLADVGEQAAMFAQRSGSYKNRTWNLRNANGYAVIRDGKIVNIEIMGDGSHPIARKATEDKLKSASEDGLYLANGMFYASFVEGRDYDVLSRAKDYAQRLLKTKLGEL